MNIMRVLEDTAQDFALSNPKDNFVNFMLAHKIARESISEDFGFASPESQKDILNSYMLKNFQERN